ncbi:uracil-DNA glycosylase [Arenibacter certesii]|uniref:Uracil-DNA glycosylase n=1 Tax=Arenibacter certesii TaxID=228955 RepID=A0A918ILC7_9FLAO|nr:uracil-DNA glycosylase [Arenibacter certesii]GGW21811.1 uracil-DNA glycosylase 2 [Arenibacter certesii]
MHGNLHPSWHQLLNSEFRAPYFKNLQAFVNQEYDEHQCFPLKSQIFAAFDHCLFNETKVVIIGQDPYHGPGQANGLCFSVNDGIALPPSLMNIFKELQADEQKPIPKSGNLEKWACQGVLLLNATLTVRAHSAGSHQGKGWETFTDAVISKLSQEKEGLIFLLWGGKAQKKVKLIDTQKHRVLTTGHPSPLSANRGYWFGNKHFSKTNEILKNLGLTTINW